MTIATTVTKWSLTKMITVGATIITTALAIGGAGYKAHFMYEDEPVIQEVRMELVALGEQSVNKILTYQMQTDLTEYEDELEDLEEKSRDGAADRYDLRRLDRVKNRIQQLQRSIETIR